MSKIKRSAWGIGLFGLPMPLLAVNISPPGSATAWDLWTYGNGTVVEEVLVAIAAFTGRSDYLTLILTLATIGVLVMSFITAMTFKPEKLMAYILGVWFFGYLMLDTTIDIKIVDQIADRSLIAAANVNSPPNTAPVSPDTIVINAVPAAVGLPAVFIGKIGHWLNWSLESSYTTTLANNAAGEIKFPDQLALSNGATMNMAGNVVKALSQVKFSRGEVTSSMAKYLVDCTLPEVFTGAISSTVLLSSSNLWQSIQSTNNGAQTVTYLTFTGGINPTFNTIPGGSIISCAAAWTRLNNVFTLITPDLIRSTADLWHTADGLAYLQGDLANQAVDPGVIVATMEYLSDGAFVGTADNAVLQAAVINAYRDAYRYSALESGNSDLLSSLTEQDSQQKSASGWSKTAEVFNYVASFIYAVMQCLVLVLAPIMMLGILVPGYGGKMLGSYGKALVWLVLWEPMLGLVNFVVHTFEKEGLAQLWLNSNGFLTMENMNQILHSTDNYITISGFLASAIPVFTWSLVESGHAKFGALAMKGVQGKAVNTTRDTSGSRAGSDSYQGALVSGSTGGESVIEANNELKEELHGKEDSGSSMARSGTVRYRKSTGNSVSGGGGGPVARINSAIGSTTNSGVGNGSMSLGSSAGQSGQIAISSGHAIRQSPIVESTGSSNGTDYAQQQLTANANNMDSKQFGQYIQSTFGKDIPASAAQGLQADLQAGKFQSPATSCGGDKLGSHLAGYDNDSSEIRVSDKLVADAQNSVQGANMFNAAVTEEYGHHVDNMLRNHYSQVGGDAEGDEGALFARGIIENDATASPGLRELAAEQFSDEAIANDQKSGSMEFLEKDGHKLVDLGDNNNVGAYARAGYLPHEAKQFNVGSWTRDNSQARDPNAIKMITGGINDVLQDNPQLNPGGGKVTPSQVDSAIASAINIKAAPLGIEPYKKNSDGTVTDNLGGYSAREHIDNPHSGDFQKQHVDSQTGMMKYFDDSKQFIRDEINKADQLLQQGDVKGARGHMGEAMHPVQDFYSHSNHNRIALAKGGQEGVLPFAPSMSIKGESRPVMLTGTFGKTDTAYSLSTPAADMAFPPAGHNGNSMEDKRALLDASIKELFPDADQKQVKEIGDKVMDKINPVRSATKPVRDFLSKVPMIGDVVNPVLNQGIKTASEAIPMMQDADYDPDNDYPTHSQLAVDHDDSAGHGLAKILAGNATTEIAKEFMKLEEYYSGGEVGEKPDVAGVVEKYLQHPHDNIAPMQQQNVQEWIKNNPDEIDQMTQRSGVVGQALNYVYGEEEGAEKEQTMYDGINSGSDAVIDKSGEYQDNPKQIISDGKSLGSQAGEAIVDQAETLKQNADKFYEKIMGPKPVEQ